MKGIYKRRLRICVLLLVTARLGISQSPPPPLQEARSLLAADKVSAAEAVLRGYLKNNPSSAEAHYLLGDVLFREQKARESLAEFTAGAKFRHPGAAELRIVASDYVLLGDFADADKWFSEITAEAPKDPEAWYLLGRTKYNENRFAEAITSFSTSWLFVRRMSRLKTISGFRSKGWVIRKRQRPLFREPSTGKATSRWTRSPISISEYC